MSCQGYPKSIPAMSLVESELGYLRPSKLETLSTAASYSLLNLLELLLLDEG